MATYQIETDDGSSYQIETEDTPTANPTPQAATPDNSTSGYVKQAMHQLLGPLLGDPSKFGQPMSPPAEGSNLSRATNELLQPFQGVIGPSRVSATLSAPGMAAGDAVAGKLGEKGANPYLSAGAGMLTGAALDPQTYVAGPIGDAAGAALDGAAGLAGKSIAKGLSTTSGVDARNIMRLGAHPWDVLTAPSTEVTGEAFGMAKKAAGVTEPEEFLISKAGDRGTGAARSVADDLIALYNKDPDSLTAGQLLAGKKAAGTIAGSGKGSARGLYGGYYDKFNQLLQQKYPDVASAQAANALSQTKDAFMSLVPENKNGSGSFLRSWAAGSGVFAGLKNIATGHPLIGAGELAAGTSASPMAVGLATLLGAAAKKTAGAAIGNLPVKLATVGAIRQYLLHLAQNGPGNQSPSPSDGK